MQPKAPKLRASVPFRAVLISVVALWGTYFLIATLRWAVIAGHDAVDMMQLRAIVVLCGVVITLMLWLLLRLFDARPIWMKVAASIVLALPVALLMAQVNHTVFSEMNAKMESEETKRPNDGPGQMFPDAPSAIPVCPDPDQPCVSDPGLGNAPGHKKHKEGILGLLQQLTEITFSRYFMILAWCAIYFSMLATAQVRVAERREEIFRSAAKEAELRSLRYQVNPHFLFNTLNSLSALVLTGKAERAEKMIQTISNFYRHSLTNEPTSDVALEQEFELQRHYLNIEEVRFPERLKVEFDLPDDLADARVPGMILQPLVENSVKYAVSAVNRPVTVAIKAREEFDRLVITVTDNGPGSGKAASAGEEHGFGIGLANVRDRLAARFGDDIALSSGPIKSGYRSEIRIPLTRNG